MTFACILAATDGSAASDAAVRAAVGLTQSLGSAARLHVVSVIDYVGIPEILAKQPAGAPNLLEARARDALDRAAAIAAAGGIAETPHLLSGDVGAMILACAADTAADMLVVGFHGHNRLARLVMGSVAERLVRSAGVPVLVVREASAD